MSQSKTELRAQGVQPSASSAANPVLVEVTRGGAFESRHRGAVIARDGAGAMLFARGVTDAPVFPRSTLKPVQALPFLESGAADAFAATSEEIALACASHSGAPGHVEKVAAFLKRIGLGPDDLECGPQVPMGAAAGEVFLRGGGSPGPLHNNCSGKHAGFLAVAHHLGVETRGYIDPAHPVQQRVMAAVTDLCGCAPVFTPPGTDGCGIPAPAVPLDALARAMVHLVAPDDLPPARADAARRIVAAMMAHPDLVAGEGRFDTRLMQALPGQVVSKTGAEGVQIAILPERGIAVVVKADDGATRAAEVIMGATLKRLGVIDARAQDKLADLLTVPITARDGRVVGDIRPRVEAFDQSSGS